MENTQGYYNGKVYIHCPSEEKQLFKDAINDISENKEQVDGIEIGVLNGESALSLLSINEKINLHGIDPIIPDSMEASLIGSLEIIKSNTERFNDRFKFIHDYSFNVVDSFEDNSKDFIFIDGDHTYDAVKNDFDMYYPKIKSGGLIFFHDSRMNRGGANFHVGSSKFVDEVIQTNNNLELIGEAFSLTCFKKI